MMKQDTLPVVQRPQDVGFYRVVELAMGQGANAEQLGQLLALQERHEAMEARKAYHEAMSKFKANPPKLVKDKAVAFGNTKYKHAQLDKISHQISEALQPHGLYATWRTESASSQVTVTCRITHVQGHYEETSLSSSPDNSGGKNSIQAIGSAVSYLQRYTLLALCGLATEDDDGATSEPIDDGQINNIVAMMDEVGADKKRFLKFMGVESVENIQKGDYQRAMAALKAKAQK